MPFTTDHRMPIIRKNQAAEGLGAGLTAVFKLPSQSTYMELVLECKIATVAATRAQLETMLGNIRLTVSGKEKITLTAKQIIGMTEFYRTGTIGDTGYLWIPFNRTWMQEIANQVAANYGTLGESSIQLEVDQDATSTIDTMNLWTRVYPVAEPIGAHISYVKLTPTFGSTGTFIYTDIPRDPRTFLYAIHMQTDPAKLTNVRLIADDVKIIDTSFELLNQIYKYSAEPRTPQTAKGFAHLDLCNRNMDADAMPMTMRDLRLELDFITTAPGAFPVIFEFGGRNQEPVGITR